MYDTAVTDDRVLRQHGWIAVIPRHATEAAQNKLALMSVKRSVKPHTVSAKNSADMMLNMLETTLVRRLHSRGRYNEHRKSALKYGKHRVGNLCGLALASHQNQIYLQYIRTLKPSLSTHWRDTQCYTHKTTLKNERPRRGLASSNKRTCSSEPSSSAVLR